MRPIKRHYNPRINIIIISLVAVPEYNFVHFVQQRYLTDRPTAEIRPTAYVTYLHMAVNNNLAGWIAEYALLYEP